MTKLDLDGVMIVGFGLKYDHSVPPHMGITDLDLFNLGDYGIFSHIYAVGEDSETLYCGSAGTRTFYNTLSYYVDYIKFGAENGAGTKKIYSVQAPEGKSFYSSNIRVFANAGHIHNALNLTLNTGWTFIVLSYALVDKVCFFGAPDGFTEHFSMSLPGFDLTSLGSDALIVDLISFTASRWSGPYAIVINDFILSLRNENFSIISSISLPLPAGSDNFLAYQDDVDGSLYTSDNSSGMLYGYSPSLSLVKTVDVGSILRAPWIAQNFLIDLTDSGARLHYLDTEWINNIPMSGDVLKHTSIEPLGITASDEAEIQSWGNYEVILYPPSVVKVEISKGSPTVVYSIPSGIPPLPNSFFAATTSNGYGTFYSHINTFPVFDARVVDLLMPGEFPTVSGVFDPTDFQRYISFATPNGWAFSDYAFGTNWVYVASGIISHIESSNYTPYNPYLFYSVSGVSVGKFMQKNPISSVWQDFTTTLPISEITIIRCDDIF